MNATEAREEWAKKYWHEHQLSYDGPEPKPWETMAAFAGLEINRTFGESSRAPEGSTKI